MNEDRTLYRSRHVERFLRDHLVIATLRFDIYPIERWAGRPTGWDLPRVHEGLITWPICPVLIAATVADFYADDVDMYLLAVVAYVGLCIIHRRLPDEEREPQVRRDLNARLRASVDRLMNIELSAYP